MTVLAERRKGGGDNRETERYEQMVLALDHCRIPFGLSRMAGLLHQAVGSI
jgi:hypothetical protein